MRAARCAFGVLSHDTFSHTLPLQAIQDCHPNPTTGWFAEGLEACFFPTRDCGGGRYTHFDDEGVDHLRGNGQSELYRSVSDIQRSKAPSVTSVDVKDALTLAEGTEV